EHRFAPQLLAHRSRAGEVLALTRSTSGRAIGAGLVNALEAEFARGRAGFTTVLALARGPLGAWLARWEIATAGIGVAVRVAHATSGAAEPDRVRLLDDVVAQLGRADVGTADAQDGRDDLRWAYDLLWGDGFLSPSEARDILDRFSAAALQSAGLVSNLVEATLHAPVISRSVVYLAERLIGLARQAQIAHAELEVLTAVADVPLLHGPDERRTTLMLSDMTSIAEAASRLACPASEHVLELTARWIVARTPADHATALDALLDMRSRPPRRAYLRVARELPAAGSDAWTRAVADRFCVWMAVRDAHPEAVAELLSRVVEPAVAAARRRERATLERAVAERGPQMRSAWERWAGARGRRRRQ
ncbi:MAG: GTPase-associated protein 1, C-terminal domain, partial [Solirubrobacteraceae bacterium]|nr:GTPase-associated protein 1, C-terminal domain [Solirubrobacteraceae bacterium]